MTATDFKWGISSGILRAALYCTSTEETRPYLHGVSFEPHIDGSARLVSTDGHRLFVANISAGNGATYRSTLPRAAIAAALKGYKHEWILVEREGNAWRINGATFTPISLPFPDWTRVIPRDHIPPTQIVADFNPDFLRDMDKMAEALNGKGAKPSIYHNGDHAALVTFERRTDCMALLMPRAKHGPDADQLKTFALSLLPPRPPQAMAAE